LITLKVVVFEGAAALEKAAAVIDERGQATQAAATLS